MQIREFDGEQERTILLGMILRPTLLSTVSSHWQGEMFASRWANLVGQWCVEHHRKYSKPPKTGIVNYFESWRAKSRDEDTADVIRRFLETLSDEAERGGLPSSTHLIDISAKFFNRVRFSRLAEEIQSCVETGDIHTAETKVSTFGKVEIGTDSYVDLLDDEQATYDTFDEEKQQSLFAYPGDLGNFFLHMLKRKKLVAFQAPEKSGKSFYLIDMAVQALKSRCRVAFFAVGDMSEDEMKERIAVRIAGHPSRSDGKWPFSVRIPKEIGILEKGAEIPKMKYTEKTFDHPIDGDIAWKAFQKFCYKTIRAKRGNSFFRLACYPNDSINALGIRDKVLSWSSRGWHADVVIVDYADILAALPGIRESRDQHNATWKKLKALSQEMDCLVITATQSDAASYEKRVQDRRNFSEDKRKNAHVNGFCAINVQGDEREAGLTRLSWTLNRDKKANPYRTIWVAGCLDIGAPAIVSKY